MALSLVSAANLDADTTALYDKLDKSKNRGKTLSSEITKHLEDKKLFVKVFLEIYKVGAPPSDGYLTTVSQQHSILVADFAVDTSDGGYTAGKGVWTYGTTWRASARR